MSAVDDTAPLQGVALWTAGVVICFANLIVMLDLTIANVSLPHIASSLAASPVQGTWVITSYAAAEAIVVPLNGWLVRRFGAVRCFLTGLIAFGFCSALCGFAPSFEMLVVFRILQGLAGGPLMPLSQTLVLHLFPPEKKATGIALWSTTMLVGPCFGPILGGWLSDEASWRWIFLINIPTTALCAAFGARLLRGHETETKRERVDCMGVILLATWVTALQVMLDKGRELAWFDSPFIVILAIIAAIGFPAFLIWELTDPNPVVNLRIFRNLRFSLSVVVQIMSTCITFIVIVILPLWLQSGLGYTAIQAGYINALGGVASCVTGLVAGRLIARFGARPISLIGLVLAALIALMRTQWTSDADFWSIALPQMLHGLVLPLFFTGLVTITMTSVERKDNAAASGATSFFRTLAVPFAVAILTTVWQNTEQISHAHMASTLNASNADSALAKLGLGADAQRAVIDSMVAKESLTLATIEIGWIVFAVYVVLAVGAWLAKPPQRVQS
jgi:DHA2 family multidrug resistance protein